MKVSLKQTLNRSVMNKVVSLVSIFVVVAAAGDAFAAKVSKERYLVIYKSSTGYKAMNNFMSTESVHAAVKLNDSLSHINAMVLTANDSQQIESLKLHPEVALVEKEMFFPSPKPVNGFRISPNAVKSAQHFLSSDDLEQLAPIDAAVPTPIFKEGTSTPWGILAVNAGAAWDKAKAGANARVLVLDTGIDPEHPSLKVNFEQGRNFFESDTGPNPNDFIDKEGHGTHCAGTIAGAYSDLNGFTGVAPLAKILMGRVCGDLGCSNIAVAQGINWGIKQKVDVISMSLGGPMGSASERMAVANAEAAGVVVVAASGNDGTAKVSFPAAFPTPIAVGAVDSSIVKTSFSQYGPELDIVAPGASVVSTVPRGSGRDSNVDITIDGQTTRVKSAAFSGTRLTTAPKVAELVPVGLGKSEEFSKVNVAGKIALVSRGEIKFSEKVSNALAAKAIGVIIYNNTSGLMQGSVTEDGSEINAAVVMVEKTMGESLVKSLQSGKVISASIATVASDYASFDGTSMATPHVAGVVALIKSANKNLTPAQVRMIIQKTARSLSPNTNNEYGAGLIQADKAVEMAVGL